MFTVKFYCYVSFLSGIFDDEKPWFSTRSDTEQYVQPQKWLEAWYLRFRV